MTSRSLAVQIDPVAVSSLAQTLATIAKLADDLAVDVHVATTRSDLLSDAPAALGEIDEELGLLATILTDRALLASGFHVRLSDDARAREVELWESLVDSDGEPALIAGDHAISLILEYAGGGDSDGDGFTSTEELHRLAHDPSTPDVVQTAIETLLDDEDLLTRIANDGGTGSYWLGSDDDGFTIDELTTWLADNEAMRLEISDSDAIDQETQIEAVNRQIFVHDPTAARDFLPMLDNAADEGSGLPMFDISVSAVEALFAAAMTGVASDDLTTRHQIVSQLPETTDATRSDQMTLIYAEAGLRIDQIVNPDVAGLLSAESHAGNNWPVIGASASDTISDLIAGTFDLRFVETSGWFPGADEVRQQAANANQAIFTDVLDDYITFIEFFGAPGVDPGDPALIEDFLATFENGENNLRTAFAFQVAVMLTDDPAARDLHQLRANVIISAHEQAVADEHLQLDSLEGPVKPFVQGLFTGLTQPLGTYVVEPLIVPTADWVFAAVGTYDVRLADGDEWSVPLNEPIPPSRHPGNLAIDFDVTDEDNPDALRIADTGLAEHGVDVDGLETITGTQEEHGVSIDADDWTFSDEGLGGPWSGYGNRLPPIVDLMTQHHANQDIYDAAQLIIDSP